jgi:tetratricopeptide (TPR) repeat protein
VPSQSASSEIALELSRIRELSKSGRHDEALAAAEALASTAPEQADLLYLIAANQRCLNRIPEALETLERLEQRDSRYSLLYQERGYCYTRLRDAARAMNAFLQGVKLNPALAASWTMLERLYRMTDSMNNSATQAARRDYLALRAAGCV